MALQVKVDKRVERIDITSVMFLEPMFHPFVVFVIDAPNPFCFLLGGLHRIVGNPVLAINGATVSSCKNDVAGPKERRKVHCAMKT